MPNNLQHYKLQYCSIMTGSDYNISTALHQHNLKTYHKSTVTNK